CGRRQPRRVPPMRIEHRLQIEGRPADSFENLSSRGFSSKSIAQLSLELLDCASKVLLSLDGGCAGRHDCAQSIEWRLLVSAGRYTKRAVYASYAMPIGRTMQRVGSRCLLPGGSLGCGTNRSMSVAGTHPSSQSAEIHVKERHYMCRR